MTKCNLPKLNQHKISLLKAAILFSILLLPFIMSATFAEDEYISKSADGQINWATGYIEATGVGVASPNMKKAQAKMMAERAARVDAQRKLLEMLKGVYICSNTTVKDVITQDDTIVSKVDGILKGAAPVKTTFKTDGTVEMVMRVGIWGEGGNFNMIFLKNLPAQTTVIEEETKKTSEKKTEKTSEKAIETSKPSYTKTPTPAPTPTRTPPPAPTKDIIKKEEGKSTQKESKKTEKAEATPKKDILSEPLIVKTPKPTETKEEKSSKKEKYEPTPKPKATPEITPTPSPAPLTPTPSPVPTEEKKATDKNEKKTPVEEKSADLVADSSGIVIDASDVELMPSMAPRILNENDKEIYGPSVIDREKAINKGVCSYVTSKRAAEKHARVKAKPQSFKCLYVKNKTDFVISNKDAETIESVPQLKSHLENMKVVAILK